MVGFVDVSAKVVRWIRGREVAYLVVLRCSKRVGSVVRRDGIRGSVVVVVERGVEGGGAPRLTKRAKEKSVRR